MPNYIQIANVCIYNYEQKHIVKKKKKKQLSELKIRKLEYNLLLRVQQYGLDNIIIDFILCCAGNLIVTNSAVIT